MIAEFSHKGVWWLPEKQDEKIDGVLHFSPQEGPKLELSGSFTAMKDIMKTSRWDVVLGFTVTGKEVALLNCISTGMDLHFPGIPTSEVIPSIAFFGSHFLDIDQILLDNMSIRYSLLDEWLGISGIAIKWLPKEKETIITYKLPDPINAVVNEELSIAIRFSAQTPVSALTEANIKQASEFHIKPSAPRDFDFYQRINKYLHNLLSLATLQKIYPIYIKGTAGEKEVQVYYTNIFYSPNHGKKITPYDMLFSFEEIKNHFEEYLRKWLDRSQLLKPIHNLYFGTIHNPKMYLEHRFLSLCQATEAYHRRISSGVYQSKEDFLETIYPALIGAIPKNTEPNYGESIKDRLKYLNEFSLRKRLKEIVGTHNNVLSTLIPKSSKLIGDIVNTRNFFTHYDDSLKDKSLDGEMLYILTERLKFILEVCFLFEIGFSHEHMNNLINKTERYNYLKSKKNIG